MLYALSYTDVLKQQTFLQEGSGSMDDDGGLVHWYDAYRLSDGNIILLRNLGPMVGIAQNEAIRTVLKSFARSLPGV